MNSNIQAVDHVERSDQAPHGPCGHELPPTYLVEFMVTPYIAALFSCSTLSCQYFLHWWLLMCTAI